MPKSPPSRLPVLNLSGFSNLDTVHRDRLGAEIQRTLSKLSRLVNIQELYINLKLHEQDGKKSKFSLKAKLSTEKG